MTHRSMPEFSVAAYRDLLRALADAGYLLRPVTAMAEPVTAPVAYLRHDIDLHVPGVEQFASAEAQAGARATYYVMLAQHYNPFFPPNRAVLRDIAGMGHEIGLHYDLTDYPTDPVAARAVLDQEVELVGSLIGSPVTTISMHQPGLGGVDPFRETERYLHPHDPRLGEDLLYVSDSCRAWRDEHLLRCFTSDAPRRLLLLTHPEVWLGPADLTRNSFLEQALLPRALEQHRHFIEHTVRGVWTTHPGPRLHDARHASPLLNVSPEAVSPEAVPPDAMSPDAMSPDAVAVCPQGNAQGTRTVLTAETTASMSRPTSIPE